MNLAAVIDDTSEQKIVTCEHALRVTSLMETAIRFSETHTVVNFEA